MKPGPRVGNAKNGELSYAEKALNAWSPLPDWVQELAAYADVHGAKVAAERIGYSVAAVSVIINGKGDKLNLARIQEIVRGTIMGVLVDCPERGEMARDVCMGWQSRPYSVTSAAAVQMYRACRSGCPHSKLKGNGNAV